MFCHVSVLPKLLPYTTCLDVQSRHGAILAVAEMTYALSKLASQQGKLIEDLIGQHMVDGIKNIAIKVRKRV